MKQSLGFQAIAEPPTSRPASQPSQADDDRLRQEVARLVADLGSRQFKIRQTAQEKLSQLGEGAAPWLSEHIEDPDPEIADRVASLIRSPRDIRLRVRIAFALLKTGNPDWMERAVYMLYEAPEEACALFAERVKEAQGAARAVALPVAERLEGTRKRYALFWPRYRKMQTTRPEKAAEELAAQRETDRYDAEAAYWSAYDALLDRPADDEKTIAPPSTRPSR